MATAPKNSTSSIFFIISCRFRWLPFKIETQRKLLAIRCWKDFSAWHPTSSLRTQHSIYFSTRYCTQLIDLLVLAISFHSANKQKIQNRLCCVCQERSFRKWVSNFTIFLFLLLSNTVCVCVLILFDREINLCVMAIITLSQYKHILLLVKKKWQQKGMHEKSQSRDWESDVHAVKFFFLDSTKFNAIYKARNYHCRFRYQFWLIWMPIFDDVKNKRSRTHQFTRF